MTVPVFAAPGQVAGQNRHSLPSSPREWILTALAVPLAWLAGFLLLPLLLGTRWTPWACLGLLAVPAAVVLEFTR